MSEPRVLTQALGAPPITRLALEDAAPPTWYVRRPRTRIEWGAHVRLVADDFTGRDWLRAILPALAPSGAAAERLARCAARRGVVVTTGQQPGLFGGPIYTWSKALSALAVADSLERATGVPVAPVFWAATYDADFAESSVSYVAVNATVERLTLPTPDVPPRRMRDTPLGDVGPLLAELERAAGSSVDRSVLETVRAAYRPGQTVGGAYVLLLRALLEPLGISVLDAGHPVVRSAMRPLMQRALRDAQAIDAAVRARDDELRARGFEPKVAQVKGLSLVFAASAAGERTRVRLRDATVEAEADEASELEPNVLLRPVAERHVLPTAAYVAGPNEIAYFAQASSAASALGAPMPLALPRWGGVIVEPHIDRILTRLELTIDDVADPHAVEGRLARERMPDDVAGALARYRDALADAAERLARAITAHPPPLVPEAVVEGTRRNVQHRLDRLERRIVAAVKRREAELMREVAVARSSLYPLGKPQDRLLNLIPILARHGLRVMDAMLTQARAHAATLVAVPPSAEPVASYDRVGNAR